MGKRMADAWVLGHILEGWLGLGRDGQVGVFEWLVALTAAQE